MKTIQNYGPPGYRTPTLQNALGAIQIQFRGVGSLSRGIGVVHPDGGTKPALSRLPRVPGVALPDPTHAPCQTVLPTYERISEGPKLDRAIHRIKYKTPKLPAPLGALGANGLGDDGYGIGLLDLGRKINGR